MTTHHPIRVVAICGSLRGDSHTRKALAVALEGAKEAGAETLLLDLREYGLAFCTGEDGEEESAGVKRMREEVAAAHGIILGTPEYHGSFSGVLKNALDLMGFDEFEGKMIGLVGVAGGRIGANNALNGLRDVGRSLHAWVLPQQASIAQAWKEFDDAGVMKDERLAARVREVGREVARFASLHEMRQSAEFIELWERSTENPGG